MYKVKPQYAGQRRIVTEHTNVLIDNALTQEVLKELSKKPNTAHMIEYVAETKQRNVIKKDTVEPQED